VGSIEQMREPLVILLIGGLVVIAIFASSCLKKLGLPSLIGLLLLGILIRFIDSRTGALTRRAETIFNTLSRLGVICLLFRIGLESDLKGLLKQLKHASFIWIFDVSLSGFSGFAASHWILGFGMIPSLFSGIALTATSVGIAVNVWQETGRIDSKNGKLLIDVAELDDISGVVIIALLFGIAPHLREGAGVSLLPQIGRSFGLEILKLLGFGGFCYFFSRFVERKFTLFLRKMERGPGPMISIAGTAIIMAALAGILGFSEAIGAFFAGLVFSRDPNAVKMETSFEAIYELLVPFFFIGIGLSIEPSALESSVVAGAALLLFAIAGKYIGAGGASLAFTGWGGALLLGTSMVPRAEIAMIIMLKGKSLGKWAVPPELFGAMAVVSMASCVVMPVVLRALLKSMPEDGSVNG